MGRVKIEFIYREQEAETGKKWPQLQVVLKNMMDNIKVGTQRVKPNIQANTRNLATHS